MIISGPVKCNTCDSPYRLRVSVGHQAKRVFTFECRDCGQPVSFILCVDQKNVKAWVEPDENCSHSEVDGPPLNCHPDFLTPLHEINNPLYFPLAEVMRVAKPWTKFIAKRCGPKLMDLYAGLSYGMDLQEQYATRRKVLDLHNAGRDDLANGLIGQVVYINDRPFADDLYMNPLFDLVIGLLHPGQIIRFKNLMRFLNSLRGKPGVGEAKNYLNSRYVDHLAQFLSSLDAFFRCFNEVARVLYYVRCDVSIPPSMASASPGFENIKMLYGDGFETIMDMAILPAVLNNVQSGRRFNQFKTMSLGKYETIDKAGRMTCFADNPRLSILADNVDSQIRNASHHGNIEFSSGRNSIVYYAGRPPKRKEIPYPNYLVNTCKLYFDIFALFMMEYRFLRGAAKAK